MTSSKGCDKPSQDTPATASSSSETSVPDSIQWGKVVPGGDSEPDTQPIDNSNSMNQLLAEAKHICLQECNTAISICHLITPYGVATTGNATPSRKAVADLTLRLTDANKKFEDEQDPAELLALVRRVKEYRNGVATLIDSCEAQLVADFESHWSEYGTATETFQASTRQHCTTESVKDREAVLAASDKVENTSSKYLASKERLTQFRGGVRALLQGSANIGSKP